MSQYVTRLPAGFDYTFRPASYFQDVDPRALILSSILGEERRKDVQQRLESGDFDPAVWGEWLTESKLDDATRKLIGSIHSAFMGSEYLPQLEQNEIEIVRIVLASVTQDVISIRARRAGKRIAYSGGMSGGSPDFGGKCSLSPGNQRLSKGRGERCP